MRSRDRVFAPQETVRFHPALIVKFNPQLLLSMALVDMGAEVGPGSRAMTLGRMTTPSALLNA
jgi:hypothetical protein